MHGSVRPRPQCLVREPSVLQEQCSGGGESVLVLGGERLEAALAEADVFFASLVFDYDQVEWLSPRLARVRHRGVAHGRRTAARA